MTKNESLDLELDLESKGIYDNVKKKLIEYYRSEFVNSGILDKNSYTNRDIGIKASATIYQERDNGIGSEDIQKQIDKVSNKVSILDDKKGDKEKRAISYIKDCIGAGFYGYMKLRKIFGIPLESFTIHNYYGKYIPKFPMLVNPGGLIKYTQGTFNISSPIIVNDNEIHQGEGYATIFKTTGGNDLLRIAGTGDANKRNFTKVTDIHFSGSGIGSTSVGISSVYAWMTYIQNCYFENLGKGIYGDYSHRLNVDKCMVGSTPNSTNNFGFDLKDCPDLRIVSCVIRNNHNSNIYLRAGAGGGPTNGGQQIILNYISRAGCTANSPENCPDIGYSIYANGAFSVGIHNNVFDQNNLGMYLVNIADFEISHNTCASTNKGDHVNINGGHSVVIEGNDIRNPKLNGINLYNLYGITVNSNNIRGRYSDASASATGNAIQCTNVNDGEINGNRIGSFSISVGGFQTDGVHLISSSQLIVNNNNISRSRYALFDDVNCVRNLYMGNILMNNITGAKNLSGTFMYQHNIEPGVSLLCLEPEYDFDLEP